MGANYDITSLYDEEGRVARHFLNDEFYSFIDSWEHAMADEHFARIIDIEISAEGYANAPLEHLAELAPSERVKELYLGWLGYIDRELEPWTTGGAIHFRPHWARVLMHALAIGDALGLPDVDLRCLAMAAVFHDSRRKSPYLDIGHGTRAAGYHRKACVQCETGPGGETGLGARTASGDGYAAKLEFDPRTMLAIAWHDRNDEDGLQAIAQVIANDTAPGCGERGFAESLPAGAEADASTILRIFKDADGLDRVRLGEGGLDERFLRTDPARHQVDYAHQLLAASMRPSL